MPNQHSTNRLGSNGECSGCGQPHHDQHGNVSCAGHVHFDRDPESPTYRARLDMPRPCRRNPRPGLDRCVKHGAGSERAAEAGRRRVAEQRAEAAVRRFGRPIDTTPTEALLDTVRWCAGHVAWLRDRVADDYDGTYDGKLSEWTDKLIRAASEAVRCGIEERRVKLAESQGKLLADVIRGILGDLSLTAEQEALVSTVVPRHLRAVAG